MLYCFGYWVVRFLYFLFYHIQVEGREHIPTSGGFVLASNHRSYADPPLLATRLRGQRCVFMAKEELFRNKFFGWLIRKLGAFPVTRGAGDNGVIETAEQYVRSGRVLMIFPEGTRSKDGTLGRAKSGVTLIAAQAKVPVVAVFIKYCRKKFRRNIYISIGKMIPAEHFDVDISDRRMLKQVSSTIMDEIAHLQENMPDVD